MGQPLLAVFHDTILLLILACDTPARLSSKTRSASPLMAYARMGAAASPAALLALSCSAGFSSVPSPLRNTSTEAWSGSSRMASTSSCAAGGGVKRPSGFNVADALLTSAPPYRALLGPGAHAPVSEVPASPYI